MITHCCVGGLHYCILDCVCVSLCPSEQWSSVFPVCVYDIVCVFVCVCVCLYDIVCVGVRARARVCDYAVTAVMPFRTLDRTQTGVGCHRDHSQRTDITSSVYAGECVFTLVCVVVCVCACVCGCVA